MTPLLRWMRRIAVFARQMRQGSGVSRIATPALRTAGRCRRSFNAAVAPNLAILNPQTFEQILADKLEPTRIVAAIWFTFGCVILAMTILGPYAAVSHSVTQRTKEIAIRLALGAHSLTIVRAVVGQTAVLATAGIVSGLVVFAVARQVIESVVPGVASYNVSFAAGITLAVAGVAALAAAVPVRRALRVQPSCVLRSE